MNKRMQKKFDGNGPRSERRILEKIFHLLHDDDQRPLFSHNRMRNRKAYIQLLMRSFGDRQPDIQYAKELLNLNTLNRIQKHSSR